MNSFTLMMEVHGVNATKVTGYIYFGSMGKETDNPELMALELEPPTLSWSSTSRSLSNATIAIRTYQKMLDILTEISARLEKKYLAAPNPFHKAA
jgi:hypothetical protein